MKQFDAIIIGSGQGGTPLAKKLANQGWKTALIEKQHIGGTCVNVGCTPTKTMIASAKTAYTVAQAARWGVEVSDFRIHLPTVLERKREVVARFRTGSEKGLGTTENLSLIFGKASFTDKKTLVVTLNEGGEETLRADTLFIDVGTRPAIPGIEGLEGVDYLTTTALMELREVPEHLLILGGGYIGLEFGQMYRRFGSRVTILEQGEQILSREDADISEEMLRILQAEGINILTWAEIHSVNQDGDDITVQTKVNEEEKRISCSHLLIAAGRTPNTDGLNLGAAGVETDEKGYIRVNEQLETSASGIYALGDVKGGPAFTHISYNDHLILYHNLIEGKNENIHHRPVPYTVFTDPQLGRVGLTEKAAKEKGLRIQVARLPMSKVARAIETGDTRGVMKAVVDADTGQIIGAAMLGPEGGEVMSVLQMAMVGKITWPQIREMVFAHPLYAESLNNLFMQLESER
jgi:pyruvate/2-oxoglutarate dehydrogenase complex dihydrolipoamide dehydrogenase (E3) component